MRVHVRLEWPGVMTRVCIAPANGSELATLPALTEGTVCLLVGGRNCWSPKTTAEWQAPGVEVFAPYRSDKRDPYPRWSALLSRVRYRIDTVFGQLSERCVVKRRVVKRRVVKRVWARDLWQRIDGGPSEAVGAD
jgi:hypothetical protein